MAIDPPPARFAVRFFEAKCGKCSHRFGLPLLSDHSSGEFILKSKRGDGFAYLNSYDGPAWDAIEKVLENFLGKTEFSDPDIDRFQEVVAGCADPIDGQSFSMRIICPACQSRAVAYGDGKPLHAKKIPVATFHSFQTLSPPQKKKRVAELWRQSKRK